MEVQFSVKELEKAVQAVNKIIPKKSLSQALSGILITANDADKVQFTGADYEATIQYTMEADVIELGTVLVSGQLLHDLIKQMPDTEVTLKTGVKENTLTVKNSSRSRYDILLMDTNLYPEIATLDGENTVTVKGSVLHEIHRKTAFAVAAEAIKPIFTGVHFSFKDGILTAVGTDTHRMSRKRIPVEGTISDFIIPVKTFSNLLSLVEADNDVTMLCQSGKVIFRTAELYYQARTIIGAFPDIERAIPQELPLRAVVNRHEMLQAINRLSVISFYREEKITRNDINLSFASDGIRLQGNTANRGSAFEEIHAEVTGEPIEILLHGTQLLECLKALDSEDIVLSFNNKRSPGTITTEDDENFVHVICPLIRFHDQEAAG